MSSIDSENDRCFIAVHAGAGYHAADNDTIYKSELIKACKAAHAALQQGSSALDAVAAAIVVLENCPYMNAGMGSNLNAEGNVECDASAMDGKGSFGAVGAAPGIKNPILAAKLLAKESTEPLPHGLVRPMMLVGDGARRWALDKGLGCAATAEAANDVHITDKTKKQWSKYTAIVQQQKDTDTEPPPSKRRKGETKNKSKNDEEACDREDALNDTVGCVVIDCKSQVAAGVSSGGIVLKTPGRVGEAAVFGAGCWARTSNTATEPSSIACSITGVGERIMQHMLAKECALQVGKHVENGVAEVCSNLIKETVLKGLQPHDCGIICATAIENKEEGSIDMELGVAHCAKSMAIAYLEKGGSEAKTIQHAEILRRKNSDEVQCMTFGATWPGS